MICSHGGLTNVWQSVETGVFHSPWVFPDAKDGHLGVRLLIVETTVKVANRNNNMENKHQDTVDDMII